MPRPDYETVDDYEGRQARRPAGSLTARQERIEKALAHLDNELDRLAEQLTPVLGPERPSPTLQGGPGSDEAGSALGAALDAYSARLAALTGRLTYVCDRIDL